MTPDDEIPEHDPLAELTRRTLGRLAETDATEALSWGAVQSRARRVKVMRATTAIAACVVVLAGVGVVIGATNRNADHINVAGPTGASTTTSEPESTTSTIAPTTLPTTPDTCAPLPCGTSAGGPPVTPPAQGPVPTPTPGPADFAGTMALDGKPTTTWTMAPGDSVDIAATVRNLTDHAIWAADTGQSTSIATVCTGRTSGRMFLWWMTNILVKPGERSGREGTFTPTDLDLGTVLCEVDIVAPSPNGPVFDTDAGGDDARANFVARITAIAHVVITVQSPTDTTTTVPTATTVAAPTTTAP
jgi:hypothetical protein